MRISLYVGYGLLLVATTPVAAREGLSPSRVFELASPSIVLVQAIDAKGALKATGSGVVIEKDVAVSNCHVFASADTALIHYRGKSYTAELRFADAAHDLCSFTVRDLPAPPAKMGSASQLKVGDQTFAIGAPEGLELSLSDGLISALRNIPGGTVLQITTPISPGSSGGGLFDNQARLIGITSYQMREGQQLNFALPVEWVEDLPNRGTLLTTAIDSPVNPVEKTPSPIDLHAQPDPDRAAAEAAIAAALASIHAPVQAPASATDTTAWQKYIVELTIRNMQGVKSNHPFMYFVPAGNDDHTKLAREIQQHDIADVVKRGVLPGNMLTFGGPDSALTAAAVIGAFKNARNGSFSGVTILFIGTVRDARRVLHAVADTGATFRFAEISPTAASTTQ